ncbi:MAG: hypothetical protein Q7R77_01070 [Candidatus Daviesbacteria bacterium]|nr:hypothetical protein [Candidatus Daviesbacteria bacterium]
MTIIKKFETVEPNKGFGKKYITVAGAFLFILMLAQVWASNNVITYGEKLERLSVLSRSLNLENQLLEQEIAKNESLVNIASQSAKLGFSEPESIQYIR